MRVRVRFVEGEPRPPESILLDHRRVICYISPARSVVGHRFKMNGGRGRTYRKPNSIALRSVDTIDPARPRRRFVGGGMTASRNKQAGV